MAGDLGRRVPTDFQHVERWGIGAVLPEAPLVAEKILPLPSSRLRRIYDQKREGACVGFGLTWQASIRNALQNGPGGSVPIYDARWLWNRAKEIDEWGDTNPGDNNGTSLRAGCDVLRDQGHIRLVRGRLDGPDLSYGIAANRWATQVDEMRAGIVAEMPIGIGVNWYENFDEPEQQGRDWWIGRGDLGRIRGGHCVCVYGASDRRQAFKIVNNWGASYPLVWVPYPVMQRLLDEDGEAALIVDR